MVAFPDRPDFKIFAREITEISVQYLSFLFFIWMCQFDKMVSLGVEPDNQAFD